MPTSEDELRDLYERLRQTWERAGIALNPPVDAAEIKRFEHSHSLSLPQTFKEYLCIVNGMREGETDELLISFLSLSQMDRERNCKRRSALETDIVFAEYCIYSHFYVIRVSKAGNEAPIVASDGQEEQTLANRFEQFIQQYLKDPWGVANCWK